MGKRAAGTGEPLVRVLEEQEAFRYKNLMSVVQARVEYRRANGEMGEPQTRLNFVRDPAVAVLLHDPRQDKVVLVRQFRYPVYASLAPHERQGQEARRAWLLETVAGVQEAGQSLEETARRETLEETGYEIRGRLEQVADVYLSPGGSSERVAIFLAEIDVDRRTGEGAGLDGEGEDIELVVLPAGEALAMLRRGEIRDAKTVLALQYMQTSRQYQAK